MRRNPLIGHEKNLQTFILPLAFYTFIFPLPGGLDVLDFQIFLLQSWCEMLTVVYISSVTYKNSIWTSYD